MKSKLSAITDRLHISETGGKVREDRRSINCMGILLLNLISDLRSVLLKPSRLFTVEESECLE